MKYTYAYKTSDGIRHEAAIDAPSRESVFVTLRGKGIKAIKVVAADGSKANGEQRGMRKRVVTTLVVVVASIVGIIAYFGGSYSTGDNVTESIVFHEATPLARQMIPGDRNRLANFPHDLFANEAERFLAHFAEPGRPVMLSVASAPSEKEFKAALGNVVQYADDEFTEYIDLKRMVVKMKGELRRYLVGGGSVEGYVEALVSRQKTECEHRNKSEKRLQDLLKESDKAAYAYWLKANAQLQTMGIYPLSLPDSLREYQSNLGLDE